MKLASERISFVLESAATAAAVAAARRLGVLDRLDKGPTDATTLARDCDISERGTDLLLPALAGIGLVERGEDGVYRGSSGLASLTALVDPWEHLSSVVRHGQPRTAGDTTAGAETLYRALAPLLGELFEPAAGRAARLLASTGPRILDVGAGAAPWSRALAAQDPRRHVTALDLPQVLDAARTAVEADGLGDQFDFVAADMFSGDWPGEYDLVLAANVCHLFDEESNLVLAGRLFSALRPGGTLAVVDILPDESLDGPPAAVLYGLGLLLRTATGRAYPFSAYTKWLEAVGLQAIERRDLSTSPPFTLITSRKPLG